MSPGEIFLAREEQVCSRAFPDGWPVVRGDYVVYNPQGHVAVTTLASHIQVQGAAIFGPCKTENLGVEKVVANMISNSNLRYLVVCGAESKGHLPGETFLALNKNGIDDQGRIVGSPGAIPFIQNLTGEAVLRFMRQVEVVDRIGLEDESEINALVLELDRSARAFPEEPFEVVKRKVRPSELRLENGDVCLGCGVRLDASLWTVDREGDHMASNREGA
ncbi:MAG: tetrahydromethanopterin S-methyltransferase subunit A [Methanosarcinales archaeon]|nr:tetrahydromethanopterin S-methyltransferase subunit A [Methanosarcinales archaeon]